jgi:hypothetical protein
MAMTPPSPSVFSNVRAVSEGKARALPNDKQMVVRMLVTKHHIPEIAKVVNYHKVGKRNIDGYEMDCPKGVPKCLR